MVREYLIEKIGKDIEPPLIFACQSIEDFSLSKISSYPCIVKISNGSGQNLIIHDKDEYTEEYLKKKLKLMVYEADNSARYSLEPQYLPKDAYIVVEKLMLDSNGKLPNDYKLMKSLWKGGTEHRKYLRQIFVIADVWLPRYI